MSIVNLHIKKQFINDRRVMSRYKRKRLRALRRFGSILRRHARNKLRRKGRMGQVSAPGTPPLTKMPEPNLRTILYGFDGKTLIVGPIGFTGAVQGTPELLEHGGSAIVMIFGLRKRAFYKKRPWMQPTLEEKAGELGRSIVKVGGLV